MKPVINKQTHYNVLFMRDDGAARTYRLRCGMLRFLLILPVLLVLLSAGVIAAGLHFGKDYLDLRSGYEKQEKEISEMRLQLERLSNLETLLSASSPEAIPLARHEEVGVSAPNNRAHNATNGNGVVANGSASAPAAVEESAQAQPPEAPAETVVPESGAETQSIQPAETALAGAVEDFSSIPLISNENSPVRVSNFSGRPIGQQRIRIRYELSAAANQEGRMLSGLAKHYAVFNNGERAELPLQDSGETRFAITRMKPMEATARLPQGYDTKDIKQIDVLIVVEEVGSYHDLFEVTQWRSY